MGLLGKCEKILTPNESADIEPPDVSVAAPPLIGIPGGDFITGMKVEGKDFIMPDLVMPGHEISAIEMPELQISDTPVKGMKIPTLKAEGVEFKNIDVSEIPSRAPQVIQIISDDSKSDFTDRRSGEVRSDRRQEQRFAAGVSTLTVQNLRKHFGRKEVVRGVGFSMKGGDIAGLLGPNGAGKTTIFYMIVGFYKPTTGDIKLNDKSITSGPMYKRARMGIAYLPQEASIFRKLTVEQNIWAILETRTDIKKREKKHRLEDLIEDFGIGRIRKQYGYTLSGGERRRTEIARALATEPKFLLLDEPFAGIDPIAVFEIKQIIKHLAQEGIGILITDHNVRDTLEITSDAFIINRGVIVARGVRDDILANKTVREVYLGADFKM